VSEAFAFSSSRDASVRVGFSAALLKGLAPDGGLYVPASWPQLSPGDFAGAARLPEVAQPLLAPFLAGDRLAGELTALAHEAFSFPAPLVPLQADGRLSVLELFHGPTAAFKDFGARFLAACFARLREAGSRPLTILVATSGDTGGAVAAAVRGSRSPCSSPRASSRRPRSVSSPAGATTCARSPYTARSTTASAS
jgi:threonine synthase